jgi:hypothetical protein
VARCISTAQRTTAIFFGGVLPYVVAIPLFLLVTVPLLWRRVAPLEATGAALAGLVVNELLVGTDVVRCGVVFPTAFLFAFTAGTQLTGRESGTGLALALGLVFVDGAVEFGPFVPLVMAGVAVAIWAIGRVARSRKGMADELEQRTAELRDARDERARLEVASDRARLSGELDELLQRRLGELARMADEGSRPSDAAGATAALAESTRAGAPSRRCGPWWACSATTRRRPRSRRSRRSRTSRACWSGPRAAARS